MRLESLSHTEAGWSASFPRDLDSADTLVLAFGSPTLRGGAKPLDELARAFPRAVLLGCSTSGEIHQDRLLDHSLCVAIARFERSRLRGATAQVVDASDSYAAGASVAQQLAGNDLRAAFVLSDGTDVNGSDLAAGLCAGLPDHVSVSGGLAGDGDRFESTWTLSRGGAEAGRVVGFGVYGEHVRLGHGSRGGWSHFGPERKITRARGNVLEEIDGQPALDLYERYLGNRADGLPAAALHFPLALRDPREAEPGPPLVRTILGIDKEARSMTFAGNIPEGHLARFMCANTERLIDGAADAASRAGVDPLHEGPVLSIAVSCVGRRLVLGERSEEEIEATLESLPPLTRQVGFYSYGELSPGETGSCDLHNQTMTLTTIREV